MKLSEQEAELFYQLMWALQSYVNLKLKLYPKIKTSDDYADCDTEQKVEVRNALYKNIELIDSFVQENPQNFSQENLSIVSNWKNFISDNFYIERLLKKYTVFIQEETVYGVLGISQAFDELIHYSNLPQYVNTVLLPFKGKIIYDGLLGTHNISFGGGIKHSLKETYLRGKQNNRIIESLERSLEGSQHKKNVKPLKNWKPELEEIAGKVKKLKGSAGHPAILSPAFSLVKASVEFAQIAASGDNDYETLNYALEKVGRAFNKTDTTLYREEY
ncbi:MAG: hypothetical protein KAQ69_13020 [Spirochaetales bacterium]|nr:hypothetical protein [Spirochaetales bacterium]